MKRLLVITAGLIVAALASAQAADAKENYETHCAKCHGKDGKGQTKQGQKLGAKDYTDPKVWAELKDEEALKAIKDGYKDKKTGKELMKPAEGLTDQDMKDLLAYMKKFVKK